MFAYVDKPRPDELIRPLSAEDMPEAVFLLSGEKLAIVGGNHEAGFRGFSPDQLLAMRFADLVPGASLELLQQCARGEHDPHPTAPLRLRVRDAQDASAPVDIRVQLRPDGRLVASLRVRSEQAYIDERELVEIVCHVPVAIATWHPQGQVVSWNPAARALFQRENLIGDDILKVVPRADRPAFMRACRVVTETGEPEVHNVMRILGDGTEIEIEESIFLVRDPAGQPRRLCGAWRDRAEVAVWRRRAEALQPPAPAGDGLTVDEAARLAAQDDKATVLLLGETGVGKSTLARWIHAHSPRKAGPLLEINCAGLSAELAESELFGHERGAFTGAHSQKRGLVEAAHGGTLLLDEVAELPLSVQAKLLTFLDDGAFRRVGGVGPLRSDVRLIAATNRDLAGLVEQGVFREDLYYRLQVVPLELRPLRERPDDIEDIARAMLENLCQSRGRAVPALTPSARSTLRHARWPGNFRELKNTLERALVVSDGGPIDAGHFSLDAPAAGGDTLDEVVVRHIERVLDEEGGNRTRAAARLGIDRTTLRRRLAAKKA